MRKRIVFVILALISMSVWPIDYLAEESPKECVTPLKLSLTSDWFPYVTNISQNNTTGIDVELLKKVLALMGCEVTIVHFPERRTLFELSWGEFDIGLGASKTATREKLFHYSIPYRSENNRFAFRANEQEIFNVRQLQQLIDERKIIGINLAGWYGDNLEQAKQEYNGFVFSETAPKRLKMLLLNRVDIVIDDDVVLCSEIHKENYQNIAIHPLILHQADIHFIFNRKSISEQFMTVFNQKLQQSIANGELSSLYANYVVPGCLPDANQP